MSYPLTIHYGITPGVASSISLIPLLKINKKQIENTLKKICKKNKLTFQQLINKIESIPKGIIPYKLSAWGIKESELEKLANESFTKGRMDNNIVDLNTTDVVDIFRSIYN